MYIYMKIGKRNGKRKKKRNSILTGLGGFWPSERGQAAQSAHGGAERREQALWAWAHAPVRGGGNGVRGRSAAVRTGHR
jgi:hypothetical protein